MKILVTGAAGMIGSNLCGQLLREGFEVIGIDNYWRGSIDNLKYTCGNSFHKLTIIEDDLSKIGQWSDSFKGLDCVIHLADIVAGIGYVFCNQGMIFRKNLLINSNVSTVVAENNVGRYIYVGTACSFPTQLQSGVDSPPLKEIDQFPANPESAYGWSKLMGELDAGYLWQDNSIPSVVLVLHNVYGTPCDYKSSRAQVLPALAYRALNLNHNESLVVWGDGSQGRAFVHVSDVCNALITALTKGDGAGVIQIGTDICTLIKSVVSAIVNIVDPEIKVEFDTSKPMGDMGRCADFSKAKLILNWAPKMSLTQGLHELINWISIESNK